MAKIFAVKLKKLNQELEDIKYSFGGDEYTTDTLYFKKLQMVSVTDATSSAYFKIADRMAELIKKAYKELDQETRNQVAEQETKQEKETEIKKVLTDEELVEEYLSQGNSLKTTFGLKSSELIELVAPLVEKCMFFDDKCTRPFKGKTVEEQIGFDILKAYGFLLVTSVPIFSA